MPVATTDPTIHAVTIEKVDKIAAPLDIVWETLLEQLGPLSEMGAKPFPMVFEAWPGGRWYRDLGNNAGHYWGTVQVIKPPTLLEICGPLFMSYAAVSHVQYRLKEDGVYTQLSLIHRAMGTISEDHLSGMNTGWDKEMQAIRSIAEKKMKPNKA
jgi:hypothetical protein